MAPVIIAQITDTHIRSAGEASRNLSAVVTWINRMPTTPDAVLLSGDLANDGRPEQYTLLREILAGCDVPCFIVPGNHDRLDALRATMPADYFPGATGPRLNFTIDSFPVRIIGIDTTAPGRLGGSLDASSVAWLDTSLRSASERPTLLFMHHPPFRTGVNAADIFGFKGLRSFSETIARYRSVQRIIAGHIHCERRGTVAHATATTSISSTPQHVPELFERHVLGLRAEPAGFALHQWRNDGFVSTTFVNAGDGSFVRAGDGNFVERSTA